MTSQGYLGYAKQIRDIDYNDLRPTNYTDGFYAVASNRNCPFNEGWTYVILLSFAESICVQIAIDSNAIVSGIKTRTLVADNWGAWQSYVKNSDLANPYKTLLLPWSVYQDGTYTLPESIIGKRLCVNVGNSGRLSSTWTPSSQIGDIRSIVIPGGGVIDMKVLSATQVQITGTTPDYRVRNIEAI